MYQSSEEQQNARREIFLEADAIVRKATTCDLGRAVPERYALFAAAVQEYLSEESEVSRRMTSTEDKRARLLLADAIERAFVKCQHPGVVEYAHRTGRECDWCPQCGATRSSVPTVWLRPDWRTFILRALFGALVSTLLVACGGSTLDVGATASQGPGPFLTCQ